MEVKDEKKLDWMYKSAHSLVDREEYLLGRSVDKTLEQLNTEEKQNKLVLPTPKNHVEHECIPPSIRDFNKIVHVDQVDISAKLQEDPLVAIKKREEEARRQFLQNPVQLKKLQDALKAQEAKLKKKKKHKKTKRSDSDSDLESKITEKLMLLKGNKLSVCSSKKPKQSKETALDTILMHKFNALKDHLSEEDLKAILEGKDSSEEEQEMEKYSSGSDDFKKKSFTPSNRKQKRKKRHSSSSADDDRRNRRSSKKKTRRESTSEDEKLVKKKTRKQKSSRREEWIEKPEHSPELAEKKANSKKGDNEDNDLDRKITEKLMLLRGEVEQKSLKHLLPEKPKHLKQRRSSSSSDSSEIQESHKKSNSKRTVNDSDSDGVSYKPKSYGLVTSDGKKIDFKQKKTSKDMEKPIKKTSKVEQKHEKKRVKKLSEEEKEKLRKEMMKDAKVRDKEREENLKRHRETSKNDDKLSKSYNKELVHLELLKSAKNTTVEDRIKSKLNNIQRSSRHMDSNFSRR